ncbi:methyltransferase domain-containing protein [bacterium]|nr:methyltransferase domain-containing protein [bacterium]
MTSAFFPPVPTGIDRTCPVCGDAAPATETTRGGATIRACASCGLWYKPHDPARYEDVQEGLYHDARGMAAVRKSVKVARDRVDFLKAHRPGGELLEIGCATGEFLEKARDAGFSVHGIDASAAYAAFAAAKGLDVRHGQLDTAVRPGEAFDAIAMFHLFEHVERPVEFLEKLRARLGEGGVVFIVSPNRLSPITSVLGVWHPNFQQEDHLLFFDPASMADVARRAGFSVVATRTKEYPWAIFYALRGGILTWLKHPASAAPSAARPATAQAPASRPRPSWKSRVKDRLRPIYGAIYKHGPWFLGLALYPVMRMYGWIVDRRGRGHEIWMILRA